VKTSVVASIDTFAFRAAVEHRHALVAEAEGIDWDERYPGWRGKYASFYEEPFKFGAATLIACEERSAYVGSCIASVQHEFRSFTIGMGIGSVNGLYVLPDFRDRQIGSALVTAAVDWLNARGCPVVRLHPSENSAQFYRRLGFRPIQELEYGSVQR